MIADGMRAAEKLNIDFKYPYEYLKFIENTSTIAHTPWWLIGKTKGAFKVSYDTINEIYQSTKLLIPFAKSDESNILACFDKEHKVYLVSCEKNTITGADWSTRFHFKDFNSWLIAAQNGEIF